MKAPAASGQAPSWLTSSSGLANTPNPAAAVPARPQPWPTPQDYNEALQNLALNCADADLRGGTPELTPLGLPRAITGGFASVYRVRCGGRDWAVRCFLRDVPDQATRYAAIGRHLADAHLPNTIGFDFLPTGVRVRGQWYPILKMEWVAGETLDCWIARQLAEPAALRRLADRWLALLGALRRAGIAHGDLQHGNVLVAGNEPRLIDYDGMFVPTLVGRRGAEAGQRNYQHPRRSEADFGPHLDHFSGWVIYLSLLALSVEPALWQRCGGGDEALLLRRADFDQPATSTILAALNALPDRQLQALLPRFRSLLDQDVANLPPVDDVVARLTSPRVPTLIHRPTAVRLAAATSAASWLPDHLDRPPPVALAVNPRGERWALAGLTTFALVLVALTIGGLFAPLTSGLALAALGFLTLVALLTRYLSLPATPRKLRATAASQRAALRLRWAEYALTTSEWRAAQHAATAEHASVALASARKECTAHERAALAALDQRGEHFAAQRAALDDAEAAALDEALQALRHRLLAGALAMHSVAAADIPGVGARTKLRLLQAGVRTAGDIVTLRAAPTGDSIEIVTPDRGALVLPGIGRKKADSLGAWRRALETESGIRLPGALPPADVAALRQRYEVRRRSLARQEIRSASQEARQRAAIERRYHAEQQALVARGTATRDRAKQRRQASAAAVQRHTERVAAARLRLALAQRDRATYAAVTFGRYLRLVLGLA